LVKAESQGTVPSSAKKQIVFEYDYLGRRISKTVNTWNGSTYVFQSQSRFLFDGWNLVGEFDIANNFLRSYAWGADLSGSAQGAGGVGGLVGSVVASGTTYFTVYDGNGNVTGWVSGADGSLPARMEYGPFGEVIRATSSITPAIPIRWSTKYTDLETDLVYYGYRYYNPSTGRWLSRDTLGEGVGANLYGFVRNDPLDLLDILGLEPKRPGQPGYITPLPPAQPTAPTWWAGDGPPPEDGKATIVCDGKGGIRIKHSKGFDPGKLDPCVLGCLDGHEWCHRADALAANPSICAGKPDGTEIKGTDAAVRASEIKCSQGEIDCLKDRKGDCSCNDAAINTRIPIVEAYRDSFKTN
jgi:RHS repeat-associated protein